MTDARTELVGAGYDVIGERFLEWRDRIEGDPRDRWVDELINRLEPNARVVDLGCGAGVPDLRRLSATFTVTGVDISAAQLARAKANVPTARLVHGDLTTLELEEEAYDAALAVHSINHVPRELYGPLFERTFRWLRPGAYFLLALGTSDDPGWTGTWLGAPMYFSSFPPEMNRDLLRTAGFELVLDEIVTIREPDGEARTHWVLARR